LMHISCIFPVFHPNDFSCSFLLLCKTLFCTCNHIRFICFEILWPNFYVYAAYYIIYMFQSCSYLLCSFWPDRWLNMYSLPLRAHCTNNWWDKINVRCLFCFLWILFIDRVEGMLWNAYPNKPRV
jgi:hypothetical protein